MFALIALAHADPVVHAEDPEAARARVAAAAKVDPSALEPVALATLAARPPIGLGEARVIPCSDVRTRNADVAAHLTEAEGAYLYMESDKATTALGLANNALNCLSEPLDPALASRVWYLRGLVAFAANDAPSAEAHFYRARVFTPGLAWDEDFAPAARPLFEKTAVQLKVAEPAWLDLVPAPPAGQLRIDGRVLDAPAGRLAIPRGPHLVQLGADPPITLSVDLRGDGTLVVPELLPKDAVTWAGDPLHRDALSDTLAGTLQRDANVYVTDGAAVWHVHAGRDDWSQIAGPKARANVADKPAPKPLGKRAAGRWLMVGGGAILAAGGAWAGVHMAQALDAYDTGTNAQTWDEYLAADAAYQPARTKMYIGDGVAVAGAALLGVGVALAW
jgi:hypothetical protein